jgi:hypothetical protein
MNWEKEGLVSSQKHFHYGDAVIYLRGFNLSSKEDH